MPNFVSFFRPKRINNFHYNFFSHFFAQFLAGMKSDTKNKKASSQIDMIYECDVYFMSRLFLVYTFLFAPLRFLLYLITVDEWKLNLYLLSVFVFESNMRS